MEKSKSNIAIKVSNVSKDFKLPHDQQNSIKGKLINFRKQGYEVQHALTDVSFEVKKGEFFGIVGRNGSGKSTLLKILAGIYTPTSGSVEIEGKLTPFIELGVGFNPELSGRDNVFLNGALLGFSRSEMAAMYSDIVAFAELERFMDQKLKNYSSGMQVRLAFSIAIRANSNILVLDEVLAVGDSAFQQKCFDYFNNLKKSDTTIIFVTHDMSSVKRFCDRALLLSAGKIESIGNPQEISDLYITENIEKPATVEEKATNPPTVSHSGSKSVKRGTPMHLSISYTIEAEEAHYLGVSVQYNGLVVAEFNSKNAIDLDSDTGKRKVSLSIDTSNFNSGKYEIGVAVFGAKSGRLISFNNRANSFSVQDTDTTKGGPMRVEGVWKI